MQLKNLKNLWEKKVKKYGQERVFFFLSLSFIGLFCVYYLGTGEKPWAERILERQEKGEKLLVEDYKAIGLWWAALINSILIGLLLLTMKWWGRPLEIESSPPPRARRNLQKWFWLGILAAVILGAHYRIPRLSHSFWNDEEVSLRSYYWGKYKYSKTKETWKFRKTDWDACLFYNYTGNNHVLFSLGARLSLNVWHFFYRGDEGHFEEAVVRLLPLLAGLSTLILVGLFLRRMGYPLAGVAAAFFLALHPWHIRYSVEARGYAYFLFFLCLGFLFLMRALERGKWRYWFFYGGCQLAALCSFPGGIYVAACQNLGALSMLPFCKQWKTEWLTKAMRLLVVNFLGAVCFIQLMSPSALQIRHHLSQEKIFFLSRKLNIDWLNDMRHHLFIGIPRTTADAALHLGTSAKMLMYTLPSMSLFINGILPLLLLVGFLAAFLLKNRGMVLLSMATSCGALLFYLHQYLAGRYILGWYFIFLLLAFVLLIPFGIEFWLRKLVSQKNRTQVLGGVFLGIFLLAYAYYTQVPRQLLIKHDRQPMRQAVEKIHGTSPTYAQGEKIITCAVGTSDRMHLSYDAKIAVVRTVAELMEQKEKAERLQKPFYVLLCGRLNLLTKNPELVKIVESQLVKIDEVKGLEELFSYHIYKSKE